MERTKRPAIIVGQSHTAGSLIINMTARSLSLSSPSPSFSLPDVVSFSWSRQPLFFFTPLSFFSTTVPFADLFSFSKVFLIRSYCITRCLSEVFVFSLKMNYSKKVCERNLSNLRNAKSQFQSHASKLAISPQ